MEGDRLYFLISISENFKDKFISFLHNLNITNKDGSVAIETVYGKKKFAVIPESQEI